MAQTTATTRRALRGQEQRRYPVWRVVRANLYDLGLLARQSSLVLIGFAVVVLIGTVYFRFFSAPQLSTHLALYQAVKLLFFASDQKLSADLPGQVLFFLAPLLGLALLTQGALNFGRLILDKSNRREAWQVALASTYRRQRPLALRRWPRATRTHICIWCCASSATRWQRRPFWAGSARHSLLARSFLLPISIRPAPMGGWLARAFRLRQHQGRIERKESEERSMSLSTHKALRVFW